MSRDIQKDYDFLLRVLSHAGPLQVDWWAVAGKNTGRVDNKRQRSSCVCPCFIWKRITLQMFWPYSHCLGGVYKPGPFLYLHLHLLDLTLCTITSQTTQMARGPTLEQFMLTVLHCSDPLKTNWAKFASTYGYSRAADTYVRSLLHHSALSTLSTSLLRYCFDSCLSPTPATRTSPSCLTISSVPILTSSSLSSLIPMSKRIGNQFTGSLDYRRPAKRELSSLPATETPHFLRYIWQSVQDLLTSRSRSSFQSLLFYHEHSSLLSHVLWEIQRKLWIHPQDSITYYTRNGLACSMQSYWARQCQQNVSRDLFIRFASIGHAYKVPVRQILPGLPLPIATAPWSLWHF